MRPYQKFQMNKADALFQKAFALHQSGNPAAAEEFYRKALQKTPNDMETLYLLGTACSQQRKFEEAEKYLEKALKLDPRHPQALNNMGLTMMGLEKNEDAVGYYERALAILPDYPDAHNNLGYVLQKLNRLDEAEPHLRRALELVSNYADAFYNLGLVLQGRDKFEEAAQCFLRGIALDSNRSEPFNDLGRIYGTWGRFEDALASFERAIALVPNAVQYHNNRGAILEELGRYDEALKAYERAADLDPSYSTPRWNQAFLFLRQGILDRGWEKHELRFEEGQVLMRFPFPMWDGSSLEDKTLLIFAEQGLGDEVLFASCFPDAIARAKHCIIECEPRLAPLFARSFPTATVVGSNRMEIGWLFNMPKIDVQIAAGSLPRFLRPTLDSFPQAPAYLVPDPQRVEHWRSRLALLGPGMKIGICWRSGLAQGTRRKYYSDLSQWGEVFKIPGVHFVNLQYGECADELREAEERFGVSITAFPDIDLKNDIDDSAALMASVDLMICASTAVSEIGAAVGVEQYLLKIYGKQWDLLGCTDRMPWHPSIRVFSQDTQGDWETQLAEVAEALKERVQGKASEVEYVGLPSGAEVAVGGSLEDLSTYVLKEQRGWFDPEYAFVLGAVQPGMRAVDIGAGIGAYAIPLARRLAGGKLWAVTHTAAETNLLMKSRSRNALEKTINIGIAESDTSLDEILMDRHGLENIAFVRVAAGACRLDVFAGAVKFFERNSPLLMFGLPGGRVDPGITAWLAGRGYRLYRLVPGAGTLIPHVSDGDLDAYALNLFACKDERAADLERLGVLARHFQALERLPGIDLPYWQEYLAPLPYAARALGEWTSAMRAEPNWEIHWMALNLYAMAKSADRTAAERVICLQTAAGVMSELLKESANLPRLLTFGRLLTDLGRREAAVGLLNKTCELLNAGLPSAANEPFLPLADAFAMQNPGGGMGDWMVAMILEQRENLRAFSTYFTGQESLPVLEEILAMGAGTEECARRAALVKARFDTA
ncbi:MAG TPA: protein arginine N-methyltransferase [Paucimonas sp.]|nr:protein arginine N-methyltransferase [Paucimonas sp.]